MTAAINVENLVKSFSGVQAVAGLTFTVNQGELFGFLGPNGAGKTTTINMLTGLARPDQGKMHLAGIDCSRDVKAAQHLMGVVPDESNLYPELTGFENLAFCGALYGLSKTKRRSRARELLQEFGLEQAAHRNFACYSKGMKRKLTIAAALMHEPDILFLDEPTSGVDVASSRSIRKLIRDLNQAGTTIFLTTHYIEEAERFCERIAFIVSGRIVHSDSVQNLMQPYEGQDIMELTLSSIDREVLQELKQDFSSWEIQQISSQQIRFQGEQNIPLNSLLMWCMERELEIIEARRVHPALEDVFVRITGIASEKLNEQQPGT